MGDTADQPGASGVLLSVGFGLISAVFLLGFFKTDADDRGHDLPIEGGSGFRGLYLATREALTGKQITPRSELALSAIGPEWAVWVGISLAIVIGVFVTFRFQRRESMYWPVTIGMLLLAAMLVLYKMIFFIPSMGALTWANFQIRRAELPGKMAERQAAREARADAAAQEADEDEDEDEYDEDAYEEGAYEDEDEYDEEAYEEEEDAEAEAAEADDTEADDTEYEDEDEDGVEYEEEAAYDEDEDEDVEYEDEDEEDAVDEYDDEVEADDTEYEDDEPEPSDESPAAAADDDGDRIVDYDEDILKELEAEIDESDGGGAKSGPR
jgi:hypothetical protein